jgi:hypothetical protein
MVRAVQLPSRTRERWLIFGVVALATGCATSAPPLPPDQTSVDHGGQPTLTEFDEHDRALGCADVASEWRTTNDALAANNRVIEGNRAQNQVAGYFGALFIVPAIATNNNDAEKDEITRVNQRRDTLIRLNTAKHCPDLK